MGDMKLLMEDWREFSGRVNRDYEARKRIYESYTSDSNHIMYLFDGFGAVNEDTGHISPFKADFNVVLKEWEDGNLSDEIFFANVEKSFEHEVQLMSEIGSKAKMRKAVEASEEEDVADDPAALEKLKQSRTLKFKMRQRLYAMAGSTFGKGIVIINSVLKRINAKIQEIIEWANDPKRNQKLAPRLIKGLLSITAPLAKAGKAVLGVVSKASKLYGHPYVRIGALVVAAAIILAAMTTGLGVFAAAAGYPAWAVKREMGKAIVAGTISLGKLTLTEGIQEDPPLLLEFLDVSEDILGRAADLLASAVEDQGASAEAFQDHVATVSAQTTFDGEMVADTYEEPIDRQVWSSTNEKLSEQHDALETLLNVAKGKSDISIYEYASPKVKAIIDQVVAQAELLCAEDPAACVGNEKFLAEIQVMNTSIVESEHISKEATNVIKKLGHEFVEELDQVDSSLAVTTGKAVGRGAEGAEAAQAAAAKAAQAQHAATGGIEAAKALREAQAISDKTLERILERALKQIV